MDAETAGYGDFEFERRFLVYDVPPALLDEPTIILQSYYVCDDGYALRVRVQASGQCWPQIQRDAARGPGVTALLAQLAGQFDFAAVTVKGPSVGGTRYEAERDLDPGVAAALIARGGAAVVKARHSYWLGADGWVIDVFAGANAPLIVAECERAGPVTDLEIPKFCVTELTDDPRFANESLARHPYNQWASQYATELAAAGTAFRADFGENR